MQPESYDVAVIGGGGAGTMAFLRAVLNWDRSVLFLGDAAAKKRGRATWVSDVDNIPGMHDLKRPITSTTSSTLKWIKSQANLKDKASIVKASVTRVEKRDNGFVLHFDEKGGPRHVTARFVVLATGIMDVQPNINGSIEPIFPFANRGDVLYCLRCDGHRTIGHRLSIIGHDDTAVGIAAIMQERYGHEKIAILGNRTPFAVSERSSQLASSYGMQFYPQAIAEILGDPKGGGLEGYRLDDQTTVKTDRSIVALGSIIYNKLLTDLGGDIAENGRVIVNERFETSVSGFFAVGDLVTGRKMQIYTGWDEAVDAADEINRRLRSERRRIALTAAA